MRIIYMIADKANETIKPILDSHSKEGLQGIAEISDFKEKGSVIMNLLGIYEKDNYPGEAFFSAIHAGLEIRRDDVVFAAILASMNNEGIIQKRELDDPDLEELAGRIDETVIDGIHISVQHLGGNRIVLVLNGENISDRTIPNDPGTTGVSVPQITAKDKDSKITASILNKFIYRTNKLFTKDFLNDGKEYPANIILIESTGMYKENLSFNTSWNLRSCFISDDPLISGLGKFVGMQKLKKKAITNLKDYDFLLTDIINADIINQIKKTYPNAIVALLFPKTNSKETPFIISGGNLYKDKFNIFSLVNCRNGIRLKGNQLMRYLLSFI